MSSVWEFDTKWLNESKMLCKTFCHFMNLAVLKTLLQSHFRSRALKSHFEKLFSVIFKFIWSKKPPPTKTNRKKKQ